MRMCNECNAVMTQGFVVDDLEYFCSESCLHCVYTEADYQTMYRDNIAYWTEWEVDECDDCNEEYPIEDFVEYEIAAKKFHCCTNCYDEMQGHPYVVSYMLVSPVEVKTDVIPYKDKDSALKGFLYYRDEYAKQLERVHHDGLCEIYRGSYVSGIESTFTIYMFQTVTEGKDFQ